MAKTPKQLDAAAGDEVLHRLAVTSKDAATSRMIAADVIETPEWLCRIAPIQTVFGTRFADVLSTKAEGEVLDGLAGDDTITSNFNRTALIGASGKDTLTSTIEVYANPGETVYGVAIQFGGGGNDILKASLGAGDGSAIAEILLDGGNGNDLIEARAFVVNSGSFSLSPDLKTVIKGGAGDDVIDAVADGRGSSDGSVINDIEGGVGDDRITAFAVNEFTGIGSVVKNVISGGNGDDVIDATATAWSNFGEVATNSLHGGRGDDIITARNETDSNRDSTIGLNELWGEEGRDTLEAFHFTDGENSRTSLSSWLDGGTGDDSLTASSVALGDHVSATHTLLGGSGADLLSSSINSEALDPLDDQEEELLDVTLIHTLGGGSGADVLTAESTTAALFSESSMSLSGGTGNDALTSRFTSTSSSLIAVHHLEGDAGHDTLNAELIASFPTGACDLDADLCAAGDFDIGLVLDGGTGDDFLSAFLSVDVSEAEGSAISRLDGGSGNDVLDATVAAGKAGASFLNGGVGDDRLIISGGTGNVLDGGFGTDTFVFDLADGEGTHTIADFESNKDILEFIGLADNGFPGLVDDLDALSTFADLGVGEDVVVELSVGTQITFSGLGTGAIDTWAQVVSLPSEQILIG